jgi:hypothetical protein
MPSHTAIHQRKISSHQTDCSADILIDRTSSGSTLLAARTDRGQLFLKRIHGSFWNGRCAFFQNTLHADDMIHLAQAMGMHVVEQALINQIEARAETLQ